MSYVLKEEFPTASDRLFKRQNKMGIQTQSNEKYTPYPAIPADIGYASGKSTRGAVRNGIWERASANPAVLLGLGLTGAALLGMLRKSFLGDKFGAQRYMRYRIMAQFFTVTALVAGVTLFGATYESSEEKRQRLQ